MEKEIALFDLPFQWIFPAIFISMTVLMAYFFVKYVILDGGKGGLDLDEEDVAESSKQTAKEATSEVRDSVEEKKQK